MFEGFSGQRIDTGELSIHLRVGGSGPPLLLLHGYPQNHLMWHAVAPILAQRFTVVCPDLRGYGQSDKPRGDEDHETYSKRAMARDQLAVMRKLGFDRFSAVGHDRGGHTVRRLCLDNPEAVEKAAIIDIAPLHRMLATITRVRALTWFHWTFLAQPPDLPEHLIGLDPDYFINRLLGGAWGTGLETYHPDALADYRRCFRDPAMIHATCEDYRAGATTDFFHDDADRQSRIACPLLVLWGARGILAKNFDVLATWREYAADVTGVEIDAGHFLPEERPTETAEALLQFLAD